MSYKEIVHENYKVVFEEPTMYVDNEKRKRSGHMSHGMTEFAPGSFIDFNANCSLNRFYGHSAFGWVEYRISHDNGKTYSEPKKFPYSWDSFLDGIFTVSVEKAVTASDGTIVAFCLRNTTLQEICCEPWLTPMCVLSHDGGETWEEPYECIPYKGRIYDAVVRDGVIYAMIFCSDLFIGSSPENVYRVYASKDNGRSFQELSVVPWKETKYRAYCSMLFDKEGVLHAYAYNSDKEREMDHAVSSDCGKTWTVTEPSYVAKGIRNPQTTLIDGVFILHGRGENGSNFVFYTSEDAYHWDEGTILGNNDKGHCYYSNNIKLHDDKGDFLLVQYSDPYDGVARVNVKHMIVRVERT